MKTIKMTDFFCRSPAATAICSATDRRSVLKPIQLMERRAETVEVKYSRLIRPSDLDIPPGESTKLPHHQRLKRRPRRDAARSRLMQDVQMPEIFHLTIGNAFQVVDMRVSLHCQGCAGKVKKHIAKMEGVTSFSIDLETKKVTVRGHISPTGVLESVSKVKKAEFWSSPAESDERANAAPKE